MTISYIYNFSRIITLSVIIAPLTLGCASRDLANAKKLNTVDAEAAYFNNAKDANSIQSKVRTSLLRDLQSASALEQIKILANLDKGSTYPSVSVDPLPRPRPRPLSEVSQTRERCPDLVACIMQSPSMDDKERQYWISALGRMTTEQLTELRNILESEKARASGEAAESSSWPAAIGESELSDIRRDPAFSKYFNVFDNLYLTSR